MDWGKIGDSLVTFLIPALITLGFTLFAHWILTNWKIKREFRIKLLEETIKPLYKLASDVLGVIEVQRYDSTVWTAPDELREIIISDVRFSMLKDKEKITIERMETILTRYEKAIRTAQLILIPLWETPLAPIANMQDIFDTEMVRTILRDGVWSAFMDQSSPTAEELIQEANIEKEAKKQFSELAQYIFQLFEDTKEYKNYITTRDEALLIIKDFRESLTKWTSSMFSLTSR